MQASEQTDCVFKIVLVGDAGVGKTSISRRYINPEEDLPPDQSTVALELFSVVKDILGTRVKISLWDTAGQDRYRSLGKLYYRGSLGIIFVYDLTSLESFNHVRAWMEEAQDAVLSWNEVQKIIIGNKADLPRQVSAEMVRREFGNDNKIRCYEVDTRTPKGIAEIQKAMGYLIDQIAKFKAQSSSILFAGVLVDRRLITSISDTYMEEQLSSKSTVVKSSEYSQVAQQKNKPPILQPQSLQPESSLVRRLTKNPMKNSFRDSLNNPKQQKQKKKCEC